MRNRRLPIRRGGLTLVELIVVIAIILTIAALAAAFIPNVSDSQRTWSSVDLLEQWLLTAKMRAKHDSLPTGIRFIPDATTPGQYSQFVYIQQPDPLVGGTSQGNGKYTGGYVASASPVQNGTKVDFGNVDFHGGQPPSNPAVFLVQPGDYLELRDGGGVHPILGVSSQTSLLVSGNQPITITAATSNYRILRQPRQLLGENPLQLPGNMVVDTNQVPVPPSYPPPPAPKPNTQPFNYSLVSPGVSGMIEILFAPSGAVVGNNAEFSKIYLFVRDYTLDPADIDFPGRCGIVGVQTLTGYIGAYNSGPLSTRLAGKKRTRTLEELVGGRGVASLVCSHYYGMLIPLIRIAKEKSWLARFERGWALRSSNCWW